MRKKLVAFDPSEQENLFDFSIKPARMSLNHFEGIGVDKTGLVMCMAVYNPDAENSIELSFVMERLYLRKDGATQITVDILVKNIGNDSVKRLRCLFPYALTDKEMRFEKTISKAESRFEKLKQSQIEHIRISTLELLRPENEANWIYRIVRYANIGKDALDGEFSIERQGQLHGTSKCKGFIKQGWEIKYPDQTENNVWLWFLYAINETSIFDIAAPPEQTGEHLAVGESMWLRLCVTVPPMAMHRYSTVRRIFARQLEFLQVFMSADAVVEEVRKKLQIFTIPNSIDSKVHDRLLAAKLSLFSLIPSWAVNVPVNDWRMFIYREFSFIMQEPVQRTHTPWRPTIPRIYTLPIIADDRDCRRGPGPRILHRALFRGPRSDRCQEFWMGHEHGAAAKGGYIIEITSLSTNSIYNYITWAGLLGLILSILNFLRVFCKLI